MISWTRLLTGQSQDNDELRYSDYKNSSPKIVVWNITPLCNLSCLHCYLDATHTRPVDELSKKEAEDFISDLAGLKVPVLIFSGGEPLLREDIFELGSLSRAKGIRTTLSTNGTLITKDTAKRLKDAGFSYIGISLDGREDTNDRFRQNRGAYQRAREGLRHCRDAGLKTGIRFTLTKYNFRDVEHIFELAEIEAVSRLCFYHLVYSGRGKGLLEQDLSHRETRYVLESIWQKTIDLHRKGAMIDILTVDNHADGIWLYLKLRRHKPWYAEAVLRLLEAQGGNGSGRDIACVDYCGNIYPDQFLKTHPLGNIREKRFSEVWQDNNSLLQALRNRKTLIKGRCQKCRFFAVCNGNFRARAETFFGDLWQEDPACYLTDEEIYKDVKLSSALSCTGIDA